MNIQKKDCYIEVFGDKYYAFEPQLSFFNLTEEDMNSYKESLEKLKKIEENSRREVDEYNKKAKEEKLNAERSMRTSNVANVIITIIMSILTISLGIGNDVLGVILFFVTIAISICIYKFSHKVIFDGIKQEKSYSKIDKNKYIDKDIEKKVQDYEDALFHWKDKSGPFKLTRLAYFEEDGRMIITRSNLRSYIKVYKEFIKECFKLCGNSKFMEYENIGNLFFGVGENNEKTMFYISTLDNGQSSYDFRLEYFKMKDKLLEHKECKKAYCFCVCQGGLCDIVLKESGIDDEKVVIQGVTDLSMNATAIFKREIARLRWEYYGFKNNIKIAGEMIEKPWSLFYKNGNVKYFGKSKDGVGAGKLYDKNENIIKEAVFKKGEIDKLDTENPILINDCEDDGLFEEDDNSNF